VLNAAYCEIGRDTALIPEDDDYMHNAITWLYQVRRVARFGRGQLNPEHYLEIRFEDICADPETVLARVSGFVGLAATGSFGKNLSAARAGRPAPTDERAEWVWKLCGPVAEDFGYVSVAPPGR
jgi:hypothetical protein